MKKHIWGCLQSIIKTLIKGERAADKKDIQAQITASTTTIQELHEELQMLESHFVAQKSNEKSEPGKSPQEEKIKVKSGPSRNLTFEFSNTSEFWIFFLVFYKNF